MGEHAALDAQDGGDVDVLLADGVEPGGEAVQQRQEEHPGELDDVEDSLQDVIWSRESRASAGRQELIEVILTRAALTWTFRHLLWSNSFLRIALLDRHMHCNRTTHIHV